MSDQKQSRLTYSSDKSLSARENLLKLFNSRPVPDIDILGELGLFTRSIMLAKTLYLNELYNNILNIPGVIIEFGVLYGSNMALFNNLRSVYEPYNRMRRVIGFDTFTGYPTFSTEDRNARKIVEGNYVPTENYVDYLAAVLESHEEDNVVSHIKKYEIVQGNAIEKSKEYFEKFPETVVALAYFDMAMYEPTKKCLEVIRPHLIKGSIIALDEFGSSDFPGEIKAFKEVMGLDSYKIVKSKHIHDRSYVIID